MCVCCHVQRDPGVSFQEKIFHTWSVNRLLSPPIHRISSRRHFVGARCFKHWLLISRGNDSLMTLSCRTLVEVSKSYHVGQGSEELSRLLCGDHTRDDCVVRPLALVETGRDGQQRQVLRSKVSFYCLYTSSIITYGILVATIFYHD